MGRDLPCTAFSGILRGAWLWMGTSGATRLRTTGELLGSWKVFFLVWQLGETQHVLFMVDVVIFLLTYH